VLDEQPLEGGLDRRGRSEDALEPRPAASGADDREIARAGVAEPFPVEDDRDPRREVRLADDELAALLDLDDEEVAYRWSSTSAAASASSDAVAGSSTTSTSGSTPRRVMSIPAGVR
jgi:hypothetical protein